MHKLEIRRGNMGAIINELMVFEKCQTPKCDGTRWFYPLNDISNHICDRCHSTLMGKDLVKRQQARIDYHVAK